MSSRFIIRWFSGRVTPCSAAIDRRLLGAAQHVAQRQAAGHRVGVRIVVQEDEDAVGVAEEPLILLNLRRVSERLNSVSSGPPKSSESAR